MKVQKIRWHAALATLLFALAAATDYLDGWLARASGKVSEFGRFLDPIADKVIVLVLS